MSDTNFVRPGLLSLLCPIFAAGCLLTTGGSNDDAESGEDSATTDMTQSTTQTTTLSTSADDTGSEGPTGEETAGPTGECTETLIVDGGFEGGTPSEAWDEASTTFGTPICDATCTEDPGADPFAGDWWAWFGGVENDPEVASVSQQVTIDGDTAYLSMRFWINASAGTGSDFFSVSVDETVVFMATDLEIEDFDGYTPISLDVSAFADGATHTITLASDHTGNGLTSFFVDEVALVACTPEGGTTTSGDSSSGGTDTTATSGSSGSTGGDSSSGGSSSGGSDSTGGSSTG